MHPSFIGTVIALGTAASAFAATDFHSVSSGLTSSVLHGGDRELTSLGFTTSTSTMNGSNFLNWDNGTFSNNVGSYGWNTAMPRDMGSSNSISGNADRADSATLFGGEGGGTGTLAEVFGSFGGYKNMSWIIDGEDDGAWTLDLFLAAGLSLNADSSSNSVELALLERGGNSDLKIRGIRGDGTLTGAIDMLRGSTGATGWTLDSLEIDGSQQVHGVGISLDSSWQNIVGFRFEAANGMNGPDLVGVGVTNTLVPTPGAIALLTAAALVGRRRRR